MNNYELLYILPSGMTGAEIKSVFGGIEEEIKKLGGERLETLLDHPFLLKTEVSKEEDSEELKNLPVIKRKLAYPIKKNRFGFYCLFNFKSDGEIVKEIDKQLKMNSNVLRYMLLQADPMTKDELALLQKLFARKRAEQEKEGRKEREAQTAKKDKKAEEKIVKIEKKEVEEIKKIEEVEEKELVSPITKKEDKAKEEEIIIAEEKEDIKEKAEEAKEISEKEEIAGKEEPKKGKKPAIKKRKKIKLEELEDKLDEILEDTMI